MLTNVYGIKTCSSVVASDTPLACRVDNDQHVEAGSLWPVPPGIYARKQKLPDNLVPKEGTHLPNSEGILLICCG